MLNTNPLVSCLCISKNRVNKLKRAIDCFNAQTYPNKELIILYLDNDIETHQYLLSQPSDNLVRVVIPSLPEKTLGELRNISIEHSKGTYFCTWDDDDWYHSQRLSKQVDAVTANYQSASVLTNIILFDEADNQAYFSLLRLWEQSILCEKAIISSEIRYPAISIGEDAVFVDKIVSNSRLFPVVSPNLYIYVYHGSNTCARDNFESFFRKSLKLSESTSCKIKSLLEGKYSVSEGSELLSSKEILQELDYFYAMKIHAHPIGAFQRNRSEKTE
jgi:glycosyltransferase involved in cell wall biosynthesis